MSDDDRASVQIDPQIFGQVRSFLSLENTRLKPDAITLLAHDIVSHLDGRLPRPIAYEMTLDEGEIEALCDALIGDDDEAGAELVLRARHDGMTLDTVYMGYLATAARRLGQRWEWDSVTSAEITIAAGRIYAILRGLRQLFVPVRISKPDRYRALFASVPGEIHTLGVTIAADMFRRRGWQVDLRTARTQDELIAAAEREAYPVIGLSASNESAVFPMARLIVALRIILPHTTIIVGGKISELVPEINRLVDADYVANDPREAMALMQRAMETAEGQRKAGL